MRRLSSLTMASTRPPAAAPGGTSASTAPASSTTWNTHTA